MKSLTEAIAEVRGSMERDRARMKASGADPRDAHEAGERYEDGRKNLAALERSVDEDRNWAGRIREILKEMEKAAYPSRARSLAITHLEDAEMRLRSEVGNIQ